MIDYFYICHLLNSSILSIKRNISKLFDVRKITITTLKYIFQVYSSKIKVLKIKKKEINIGRRFYLYLRIKADINTHDM